MPNHAGLALGTAAFVTTKTIAELCKDIGLMIPVPGLAPAATLVLAICAMCKNASINEAETELLAKRCYGILCQLKNMQHPSLNLHDAVERACASLKGVEVQFEEWSKMNRFEKTLLCKRVSNDIAECHIELDRCLQDIGLAATVDTASWQGAHARAYREDHEHITNSLGELLKGQLETKDHLKQTTSKMSEWKQQATELMGLMQEALRKLEKGDHRHEQLQAKLLTVKDVSLQLPPQTRLRENEVTRIGHHPVGVTAQCDIWEGLWLGSEKVAIKVLRGVHAQPQEIKRFHRESNIWRKVWEKDEGRHFLAYYGTVTDGGPSLISPWQSNGNAIQYCKRNADFDRTDLIKGISAGIEILHTWTPSTIVHGDIKGENILISDKGQPLITDFSLSKILEDVTGVPFTQSKGISDSYRWFAPEICCAPGILSRQSDMFAFGMTILELITAEPPFCEIRRTTEVLIKLQRGLRPARPVGVKYQERGLTDNLWRLMEQSWLHDASGRLTIQEFIEQFR